MEENPYKSPRSQSQSVREEPSSARADQMVKRVGIAFVAIYSLLILIGFIHNDGRIFGIISGAGIFRILFNRLVVQGVILSAAIGYSLWSGSVTSRRLWNWWVPATIGSISVVTYLIIQMG